LADAEEKAAAEIEAQKLITELQRLKQERDLKLDEVLSKFYRETRTCELIKKHLRKGDREQYI